MKNKKIYIAIAITILSVIAVGSMTNLFMRTNGKKYTECIVSYPKNGTEKSVFASNGKESFICCSEGDQFSLYYIDENNYTKLPYKCSKDERIIRMAVDDEGNCSMLIYSAENEIVDGTLMSTLTGDETEIVTINKSGEVIESTDVTAFLTNENVPSSFTTHDSKQYALDCSSTAVIGTVLDGLSNVHSFDLSGIVTAVDKSEDEVVAVIMDGEKSVLECINNQGDELWKKELPKSRCKYGICTKNNNVIYLYNKELGVYYCENGGRVRRLYKNSKPALGAGMSKEGVCILYDDIDKYELHFINT